MKNTSTTFAASLVLALSALSAGQAFAGDAADIQLDMYGASPRQMFPAHYGAAVSDKTRAEVRAEGVAARSQRDAADSVLNLVGQSPRQLFPARYPAQAAKPTAPVLMTTASL